MSIVAFTVVLTGLCLALGLAVTLLGLPVLLVTFAAARLGARIDRRFGRATLGTGAGEPERRLPSGPGPWRRFVARLLDPWSWRESGYHLAAFPLSTVAFTLTLSLWSAAVGGITFYAWWWAIPEGGFLWDGNRISNVWEAVLMPAGGVILLFVTPWIVRGITYVQGALIDGVLGTSRATLEARAARAEHGRHQSVDASAAERRRIERDLHDGAQARLVHLAMDLGRAREKLADGGDDEAAALVAEAHEEAKRALAELRDLARGIHPAILTDRGLDAALSSLAARAPVPVHVHVDLAVRPSPAVEAVAYFIVAEALTNIARHSGATRADVAVARQGNRMAVSIHDDGHGGADASGGTGLANLAARVASVDGHLQVVSPPGGPTTVLAELPCA